jgi:hypothetical protein
MDEIYCRVTLSCSGIFEFQAGNVRKNSSNKQQFCGYQSCLMLGESQLQISGRQPTVLTDVSRGFLSLSRQTSGMYFKRGIHPDNFQ